MFEDSGTLSKTLKKKCNITKGANTEK